MNSLGLNKAPSDTRVVVAMSGGVDSSVTAAMLKAEGYDVVGITLQLYDHGAAIEKRGACCAGQDIYDARRVAEMMDFPHYVLDYESRFRDSVIDDFADSYLMGETPIPCVRCNQTVKFRDLLDTAKDLKGDVLATGHYIDRRIEDDGTPSLYRAYDGGKDQSYFLFATTAEQLDFLRFPLGAWPKSKTRELAQQLGLAIADKPDSQDICFVPNGDYSSVIKKFEPKAFVKGNIKNIDGKIIGVHDGIVNFTIGQRKGLKVASSDPYFVVKIDTKKNEVIVGSRDDLLVKHIYLRDINLLCKTNELNGEFLVKVRSTGKLLPCNVSEKGNKVVLEKGEGGVSPGQACVFYKKDDLGVRVFGGGWIKKTEK